MHVPSKILLIGPSTFRTFRCIWMLEELRVKYDHSMALPRSKEALKYHPMGKIPSLVVNDGEFCLYESSTINTFLADCYQGSKDVMASAGSEVEPQHHRLIPRGPSYDRAKYDQTVTFIVSELDAQGLWIHRKHHALGKIFGHSPEAVSEAKRQFDGANQVLINQFLSSSSSSLSPGLNTNAYLLGSHFTAADILYVHCLEWAEEIGWANDAFHDNPQLKAYLDRCRAREGYRIAHEKREQEKKAKEKYVKDKEMRNKSKM